jgi:translocation and assembly module TamB
LADLEILGLLTTGSAPSGALFSDRGVGAGSAGDAAATGSVGAESLLYGQAASLVGARVGKLFGFDQVRVEPLTSGDAVSSARVTVGKRLSRRLFVTYSLDPTSTAQEILQAEWRVSDQLVLVLTQNGNESFSVDARWESRF